MNRSILRSSRTLLPAMALWLAAPAFAGDQDQLKCGVNQDRVWVYDSLASMDVGARLKCGENVEIVARVKGYVRIRSANGAEGYVPDSALPDLPPLPDPDDKIAVAGSAAPSGASGASLAAAAKAAVAATEKPSRAISTASVATSASQNVPPQLPQQDVIAPHVTSASAQPPVANPAPVTMPVPVAPAVAANPSPQPAPVSVRAAAPAPVTVAPIAAATAVATPAPAATPVTAAPIAAPLSAAVGDATAVSAPARQGEQVPVKAASNSTKHAKPATPKAPVSVASSTAPVKPSPATISEATLDTSTPMKTYPVRDVVTPSSQTIQTAEVKTASSKMTEVPIGAEYPDTEPVSESADPACHTFFSAYGLSPSQFKWLAANRQKLYPSICPAPTVGSVDFVVLFTHDSDTYNVAMPTPVHTDRSGFSDFNPLTEADTALLSGPDADHARREYVWVFRMRRGGFDPMKFSPRRRPQFSTESKGSAKAIEDAFGYLQEQGTQLETSQ